MQAVQTNAKATGLLYPESSREAFYSHVLKAPESAWHAADPMFLIRAPRLPLL